ncbi:MAG: dihydrodipicolinate synthase family protein [Candidatus Micrarchaeaceae archaeon]
MKEIKGIITPTISPFRRNRIDEGAVEKLMDHLHKIGVSGVFPMGSNGASPFISNMTHKKILEVFSKFRREGELFIPGVGKNSIEDTLEISKYAEDLGSDAIVVVTPYYFKVSQASMYSYFSEIASRVEIPLLVYNIPQLTGNSITPETVMKLSENHSNIIGIKDSSGDLSLLQDYILKLPKHFSVLQGQDELLLSSLILGASGGVCGTTNFSDLAVKVMKSYGEGKLSEAIEIQKSLSRLKIYLNGKTFPQVYSFLFYKIIMGKNFTGTTKMLSPLSKKDMKEIYVDITRILDRG